MAPIFCPSRKNEQKIVKKIKDWLLRCDEQDVQNALNFSKPQ